jgi:hypothetical protein
MHVVQRGGQREREMNGFRICIRKKNFENQILLFYENPNEKQEGTCTVHAADSGTSGPRPSMADFTVQSVFRYIYQLYAVFIYKKETENKRIFQAWHGEK